MKILIFRLFFWSKNERVQQKNKLSFFNKFRMFKPGYNTHFLEVSAYVSPEVTTNGSFRDKKKYKNLALLRLFLEI